MTPRLSSPSLYGCFVSLHSLVLEWLIHVLPLHDVLLFFVNPGRFCCLYYQVYDFNALKS